MAPTAAPAPAPSTGLGLRDGVLRFVLTSDSDRPQSTRTYTATGPSGAVYELKRGPFGDWTLDVRIDGCLTRTTLIADRWDGIDTAERYETVTAAS